MIDISYGYLEVIEYRKKLYCQVQITYFDDGVYENIISEIKSFPKSSFDDTTKLWKIQLNNITTDLIIQLTAQYKFHASDNIKHLFATYLETSQNNIKLSKSIDGIKDDIDIYPSKFELKPYQFSGIYYLIKNKRVILGDEQGLGKTVQSIIASLTINKYPIVIVCEKSLKYNWKYEFEKATDILNHKTLSVINNRKSDDFSSDIIILNYGLVVKYIDILIDRVPPIVIFDESQALKNRKTQRTKASMLLVKNAKYIFELTGTPVSDSPIDLVGQISILNRMNQFGGITTFKDRYCNPQPSKYSRGMIYKGATNVNELHTKLRETCYLRRNKKEVLTELPDKVFSKIPIPFNVNKKYNDVVDLLEVSIAQKTNSFKYFARLYKMIGLAKIPPSIEWIDSFLQSGEKLVVFAYHKEVLEALSIHYKANLIYGDTDAEDRQKYVQDFQDNPKTKLIFLNLIAGSKGYTLTAASNLLFVESFIVPEYFLQAQDRIHRIGQKFTSNIYSLVAMDTVDEKVYDDLMRKTEVASLVNSGETLDSILNEIEYDDSDWIE